MDMLSKPASFSRRICAILIDVVLVAILYIIMHYITVSIANELVQYDDLIAEANGYLKQYYDSAVAAGLITYDSETQIYKLVEGITSTSPEYIAFMESEKITLLEQQYSVACNKIDAIKLVKFMIDIFVAEIVLLFIIPLCRKDHATLGKMFMKLSVINRGDIKANKIQIIIRFISTYLVETVFFYFFFEELAIVILPLVEIAFICFTKQKLVLHDLFAGTKVVENENAVIFETAEERDQYYEQKELDDLEYSKRRDEYRKNAGINMEGFNE